VVRVEEQRAVLVVEPSDDPVTLPRDGDLTIGRDPSNGVVIGSASVSRRHARLRAVPEGWLLTDEGSSNGTYVGDAVPVTGDGVIVGIGARVRFGDIVGEIRSAVPDPPSASPGTGPKVFISYSRRDASAVDRVAAELERRGFRVWVDRSGLVGGADWTTEIVGAIREADAFVVVLTRSSIASEDVANEVHLAGERKLPVFPVLLEAVEIPETLAYHLAGRQRFDLGGDDARFEVDRLVRAIGSPRVRHHRRLGRARRLAVTALVVAVVVGIPITLLSVLTGSVPPDLGRITGSRTCDGLDLELTTEEITTFAGSKTARVAISFRNSSTEEIDLGGWSVDITSGGGSGEPYRFIENEGVEELSLGPGSQTIGRVAVSESFAPSSGDEPVRLEVSDLEQGTSVFSKCGASILGVIAWG